MDCCLAGEGVEGESFPQACQSSISASSIEELENCWVGVQKHGQEKGVGGVRPHCEHSSF